MRSRHIHCLSYMALYAFKACFLFFAAMNPSRFYGTSKHVNPIPGDGCQSDDDLVSDSDPEYEPASVPSRRTRKKKIVISESDSSDDDEITTQSLHAPSSSTAKGKKNKKVPVIWKKQKMEAYDAENFKFLGNSDLPAEIIKLDSPQEIFNFLFTDELIDMIVEQSNLKSIQNNANKPANITKEEIEQFIGMVIFMSCVKLPSTRLYWSKHVGQQQVYETMTCNRFDAIKKNLHFNNNENFKPRGTDGYDKLFKVRPLLDKIRERLLLVPKEEYLAVDEQIIPTKCRHEIKQYNPAKPHKWGYKNQVLSGVSGFSYDFDIFAGDQSNTFPSDAPDLGVSSNVVTRLASTVPKHQNHKLFFDNWFNSPNLQVYLFKNGILPLGTVRLNRVPNSNMPTEKELKKKGRGSMEEKTAEIDGVKLSLVSWFDNKIVNMLSAYVGSEPTTTKQRYVRKEKQYKDITSPQAVDVYNQHMGGVDLLDSMLGYYRIQLRSRNWYKRIFFHMIDMTLVNAWLLWRRIHGLEYLPLFDFKLAVSEHMRKAGKVMVAKKRGRPASLLGTPTSSGGVTPTSEVGSPSSAVAKKRGRPSCLRSLNLPGTSSQGNNDTGLPESPLPSKKARKAPARHQELPLNSVRTDNVAHYPEWIKSTRQICQNCLKYRSFTKCGKCNVFLCFNDKRNCFLEFHKV